ncbi:MAG: uroporphyrinogen decarboxylase family protein [Planctomycetota bacterium]|jgi:hypothetical protein
MSSRDVVIKTLEHAGADRIAMALPAPYPSDFCHASPAPDPRHPDGAWERTAAGRWERTDEWGNTWTRLEGFSKGEVSRAVLEDWDLLDELELPDYSLPERYEPPARAFAAGPEKFRIGHLPGFPFNVARKMRRLDNFLVDVLVERDRAERLLAMVEEKLHQAIAGLADAGADAVMFPEDWGTQDRLLVSPQVWREVFQPGFERLCRTAHGRGVAVFIHSCGYIREAMEAMIEAGIDLFQFDQPKLYGIDSLADQFAGRTTFWCPVDIQRTLQTREAALIEADAKQMIERFGADGGGFVAGYYGSNEALGLEPHWQDLACRAFVRHGAPALWAELEGRLPPPDRAP